VALDTYRVVLTVDGEVDEAATRRLRARTDIAAPHAAGAADEAGPQLEVSPG
jgi:hypothetical protein